MEVGTTKDKGLYNKPSTAVHPGALAAGTLPQYNTTLWRRNFLKKLTPDVHYRVYRHKPLVSKISQTNPAHELLSAF